MRTPRLRLLPAPPGHHAHDLPPQWDGERIEWGPWTDRTSSIRFHGLPDECDRCGLDPGEKYADGFRRIKAGRMLGKKAVFLLAHRCQHCGHDTVTESMTNEAWDLDDTDYGPNGSHA